jgi:hypothetical protein
VAIPVAFPSPPETRRHHSSRFAATARRNLVPPSAWTRALGPQGSSVEAVAVATHRAADVALVGRVDNTTRVAFAETVERAVR